MRMKEIKNGSLYYNSSRKRVERVRNKMNSSSVTTSVPHTDKLMASKATSLRIASVAEVEKYKKESEKSSCK